MMTTYNKNKFRDGLRQCRRLLCMVIIFSSQLSIIDSVAQTQSGKASYYAKSWTGRKTANGERLHHDSMTCAHKTLPFGTLLKVTNLTNGMSVVVRVTDRGPYARGRVVDLSWGAAKAIGMITQGIAPVTVEKVTPATNVPFKPEEEKINLPEFNFADVSTGTTPVWQQLKLDDEEQKRQMEEIARKAQEAQRAMQDSIRAAQQQPQQATQQRGQQTQQKDALDEIDSKPNTSKAYLKRQGK